MSGPVDVGACGARHRPDDRGWCCDCEADCAPELRDELERLRAENEALKDALAGCLYALREAYAGRAGKGSDDG